MNKNMVIVGFPRLDSLELFTTQQSAVSSQETNIHVSLGCLGRG